MVMNSWLRYDWIGKHDCQCHATHSMLRNNKLDLDNRVSKTLTNFIIFRS